MSYPSSSSSTSIFAVLAAEGVFIYQNRQYIANAQGMLTNIVSVAAINLLLGFSGGIDNWGHLGGLLGGLLFAWIAGPKIGVQEDEYPPSLGDTRKTRDVMIASVLVLGIFGALALFKLLFIAQTPLR